MRDTTSWRAPIRDLLTASADGANLIINAWLISTVELGLLGLQRLAPAEPGNGLWALLGGYPVPAASLTWGEQAERLVLILRHYLQGAHARRRWEQLLQRYAEEPEPMRLFAVDPTSYQVTRLKLNHAPERVALYEHTLDTPPPHDRSRPKVAGSGTWTFTARRETCQAELPELPAMPPLVPIPVLSRAPEPIMVTLTELHETGLAMDSATGGSQNWAGRVESCGLLLRQGDGAYLPGEQLTLNGLLHLIGMLGAGKSTLMEVLAVHLAKRGRHVTLVVGDTPAAIRLSALLTQASANAVQAVPMLGSRNRAEQIRKLHRALPKEGPALRLDDPEFAWVSPICLLDGLRTDAEPIPMGHEPCESLKRPGEETAHQCPFLSICPAQARNRALATAQIWVTTPQALLYTRLPAALQPERMRLLELVWQASDLVVVDEADTVQAGLDMAFMPGEILANQQGGWLGQLSRLIMEHEGVRSRRLLANPQVDRFKGYLAQSDRAADRIYALFQGNGRKALLNHVGELFFTASSLFDRVLGVSVSPEMPAADRLALQLTWDAFAEAPLETMRPRVPLPQLDSILANAAQLVLREDAIEAHRYLMALVGQFAPEEYRRTDLTELVDLLHLGVAAAILDDGLQGMLGLWRDVEGPLGLDLDRSGFLPAPKEHSLVIPDSPPGNLLGFQYRTPTRSNARDGGLLRFFRSLGLGRWLLLQLPTLYTGLEGRTGPHLLLLSATSWAPRSAGNWAESGAPGYHLQRPVDAILTVPIDRWEALYKSQFFYTPQLEKDRPIMVSGSPDGEARFLNLRHLTAAVLKSGGLFDRAMQSLPSDRRRALFVVGNYDEAGNLANAIAQIRPDLAQSVRALVRDSEAAEEDEGEDSRTLARGEVSRFGSTGAQILVAPLLAIERGHNILNEAGEAALGAAFFLARPMPVPGDMAWPVQALAAWAMAQVIAWESGTPPSDGADRPSDLQGSAAQFRREAKEFWRRRLSRRERTGEQEEDAKIELQWMSLVRHWQVIGRLLRGGVPAQVYFCDAKYAPKTAMAQAGDTRWSATLLGFLGILEEVASDPIAERIYGPLLAALKKVEVGS